MMMMMMMMMIMIVQWIYIQVTHDSLINKYIHQISSLPL